MTISYSARSYVIHGISSTNYFRQSPQLQKTTGTTSDHANIIDCFWNVQHVSLMLILFTEIFIVTFINDCAATTIFTISLLRLRSVNLLFNKRICVCVCVWDLLSAKVYSQKLERHQWSWRVRGTPSTVIFSGCTIAHTPPRIGHRVWSMENQPVLLLPEGRKCPWMMIRNVVSNPRLDHTMSQVVNCL